MSLDLMSVILDVQSKKKALGHFNFCDTVSLWGVVKGAVTKNAPVVLGMSEKERDFYGLQAAVASVMEIKKSVSVPVFLNADHTYSVQRAVEAIDAGFDAVIIDGAKLSLDENVKLTKEVVTYARNSGKKVIVEAELGYIGQSSGIMESLPANAALSVDQMPKPEEVKNFVQQTGVDLLSPAVGNIHGILKDAPNPRLFIELIKEISMATSIPLVLHGGSGIPNEDIQAAIVNGMPLIHFNTELRVAYAHALRDQLNNNPDEAAPYKFLGPSVDAVSKVVCEKLSLFGW